MAAEEFHLFPKLPTELRLAIWENIPRRRRLIGQLPCSRCWSKYSSPEDAKKRFQSCRDQGRHPDWALRYVAQPRKETVFAPLHVCRESRAVWLPHFVRPPRYINLRWQSSRDPDVDPDGFNLKFDVPFISYQTDIMTIFNVWSARDVTASVSGHLAIASIDPFLGLIRERILHAGFLENRGQFVEEIAMFRHWELGSLKTLSLIATGPESYKQYPTSAWPYEMPIVDAPQVDCVIRDISDEVVQKHPFFGQERLPRHFGDLAPVLRPLGTYLKLLVAWLWHVDHWPIRRYRREMDPWWDYMIYLFAAPPGPPCPLHRLTGCRVSNHANDAGLSWVPPFEIRCKLLCDERWALDPDNQDLFVSPQEEYWDYRDS